VPWGRRSEAGGEIGEARGGVKIRGETMVSGGKKLIILKAKNRAPTAAELSRPPADQKSLPEFVRT